MKIYINSKIKEGAWGGGNQFLKALKGEFKMRGLLSESVNNSSVIVCNGYQDIKDILNYYFFKHNKKRVYRLGPIMSLHRKGIKWKLIDRLIVFIANFCVDLVIFQSTWSYNQSIKMGFNSKKKHRIIFNSVDKNIFTKKQFVPKNSGEKIKLIYTSWSSNKNKGYLLLKFLDENIDFEKYSITFIGNSPITFKNIILLSPLPSHLIAEKLRESDIFITPTKDDACSNAIIEALSSGLPVVALDSGANKELVGEGGFLFNGEQDIIEAIDSVAKELEKYQKQIRVYSMDEICNKYLDAIKSI